MKYQFESEKITRCANCQFGTEIVDEEIKCMVDYGWRYFREKTRPADCPLTEMNGKFHDVAEFYKEDNEPSDNWISHPCDGVGTMPAVVTTDSDTWTAAQLTASESITAGCLAQSQAESEERK
jgi:hypothetical protein